MRIYWKSQGVGGKSRQAKELAQQLGVLVALAGDPGLISSTHMAVHHGL